MFNVQPKVSKTSLGNHPYNLGDATQVSVSKLSEALRVSSAKRKRPVLDPLHDMSTLSLSTLPCEIPNDESTTELINAISYEKRPVIFIEDGECLQTCKSMRIDLNKYINKYQIEPPPGINKLPDEFIKLLKKFKKRALKELLELCSDQLAQKKRIFTTMYSLNGAIVKSIDDIQNECKILLVSTSPSFKGLINLKALKGEKEKRFDHASDVKKHLSKFNKQWTD